MLTVGSYWLMILKAFQWEMGKPRQSCKVLPWWGLAALYEYLPILRWGGAGWWFSDSKWFVFITWFLMMIHTVAVQYCGVLMCREAFLCFLYKKTREVQFFLFDILTTHPLLHSRCHLWPLFSLREEDAENCNPISLLQRSSILELPSSLER